MNSKKLKSPAKPKVKPAPRRPDDAKAAKPLRTDWGQVASWYDKLVGEAGSEYHREVVLPGVLRMIAPQKGQRSLDVACGQGVLCRILAERGLDVMGVDAAVDLILAARERGPEDIRYQVGDATDLSFLPPSWFDSAACVLAIQNIHPLQPVFAGVARSLKPGGKIVTVMMHPCFRGPKETAWGWDDKAVVQYRRVDRYLIPRKAPIVTHPGSAPDLYTWTFHRPISAYVKAMRNAGLLVDGMEEWPSHKTSTGGNARSAAENLARKEIPMFLAMRAVKVTGLPEGDDAAEERETESAA